MAITSAYIEIVCICLHYVLKDIRHAEPYQETPEFFYKERYNLAFYDAQVAWHLYLLMV